MSNATNNVQVPSFNLKTLTPKSTLTEAFEVSVMADAVTKKAAGASTNVYDCIRNAVVNVYREYLVEAKDIAANINISQMVGVFLVRCEEAEKAFPNDSSTNWNNYKSKLKSAMEKGLNFQENSTMGYSALAAWLTKYNKAAEKVAEEKSMEDARKSGKVAGINDKPDEDTPKDGEADTSNKPAGNETVNNEQPGAAVPEGDDLLEGLSAGTRAQFEKLIEAAKAIEESGKRELTDKVFNALNSVTGSLDKAHEKALVILSKRNAA